MGENFIDQQRSENEKFELEAVHVRFLRVGQLFRGIFPVARNEIRRRRSFVRNIIHEVEKVEQHARHELDFFRHHRTNLRAHARDSVRDIVRAFKTFAGKVENVW